TLLMANPLGVIVETACSLDEGSGLAAVQGDIALVFVDSALWRTRRDSDRRSNLKALFPDVPVVVTSGVPDTAEAERALAAGAKGYLPRTAEPADLQAILTQLPTIMQARSPDAGEATASSDEHEVDKASPKVGADQASECGDERECTLRLTAREREVVELLLNGRSNKEIGRSLSLSDGTIKAHVHNILRKAGVRNRMELVLRIRGWAP